MNSPTRSAPRRLRVLAYKARQPRQVISMQRFIAIEPLELEYLYTVLEADDVTLVDGSIDRRDIAPLADTMGAEVVLISASITNVPEALDAARRLKRLRQPPLVFVGGPHAEVVPEDFFDPAIDGVYFANTLVRIRQSLDRVRCGQRFDDVPGAAFPSVDGWRRNVDAPLDPSSVPLPRRVAYLAAPERYHYLYFGRCAVVKTAFGCNRRCVFCFCTEQHGGRYGARPIDQVLEEIASIPAESIFILDDNFLTSRRRLLEFCEGVTSRGVQRRFIAYGCADFVARNPDVMRMLRQAGLEGLIVGLEFATDDRLAAVGKSARLSDNDRTVEVCRELDIELFALFIVGDEWTARDFRRLKDYVVSREIAFATFSTYTVFPGTQLARLEPRLSQGPRWRYDLLRLHRTPVHMSPLRYYLWMLYLYLMPALRLRTIRKLRHRYGVVGYAKLALQSWLAGFEFLWKVWVWR